MAIVRLPRAAVSSTSGAPVVVAFTASLPFLTTLLSFRLLTATSTVGLGNPVPVTFRVACMFGWIVQMNG